MQLNIKSPKAYELAKELAHLKGLSLTQVVIDALFNSLKEEKKEMTRQRVGISDKLLSIADEFEQLPILDQRNADEILYDEFGLPK